MDEYRVVGPDGKEYGPVDLPGLQQWIREGRVLKDTKIRKNAGAPVSADLMPELAQFLMPPPPDPGPTMPPIATTVPVMAEFSAWGFIGQAWELFKPHWLVLSAMQLIAMVLISIVNMIPVPILATLLGLALQGVLMVGIVRATLGVLAGRTPDLEMMFGGFDRATDAIVAAIVTTCLIAAGFVLLIVPGIIIALMLMFTSFFIAETQQDFWTAIKSSVELTKGYRWELFGLALALFLILVLGLIACCIGIVVSMAVATLALALAYRFLQAKKGQGGSVAAPAPPTATV